MADDKKKIAVLGVLGAALLGVGAWQLIGSSPTPPAANDKPKDKPVEKVVASNDIELPEAQFDMNLVGLRRRDPFTPGQLAPEPTTGPNNPKVVIAPQAKRTPRSTGPRLGGAYTGLPPLTGPDLAIAPMAPDYQLVGVVDGPNPVAVFRSRSGAETMVRVNGHVGSNGKVVGINGGRVTVLENGKATTLTVGGNSQ